MKRRLGQSLTLLVILSVVCPAAASGADRGRVESARADMPTAEDKAAAAERLANRAAELAQQAAALAAESQRSAAPAAASRAGDNSARAASLSGWTSRGAEAFYVSDIPSEAEADSATQAGWRRPSNSAANTNIKFVDEPTAEQGSIANRTSIVQLPKITRPAAKSPASPTPGSEAKPAKSEALAERLPPVQQEQEDGQLPLSSATPATKSDATGKSDEKKKSDVISDGNVRPVARMLAEEEPLPAGLNDAPSVPQAYSGDEPAQQPFVQRADYGSIDGCGTDCADGCCETACCPPQRVLFWTAGVEATFLNPDLNSEGTSFLVEEVAYNRSDWVSTANEDVDSMYVSPRIWVGIQGCKWGANVRYWHLQAGEAAHDPSVDLGGDWDYGTFPSTGFSSCNYLEAYTIDFEVTRRFCLHDCWMQASAGIRHAEIWQDESIWGTAITDDSRIIGVARANRMSRGTGVVFGLYGRKPIFPCSTVSWFYNARWSAMWGPTETSAETGVLLGITSTDPDVTATAGSNNGASTTVDDNLFIGEIQLGLEWNYALQCLPATAFCRAAVEYQRWDGGLGYSSAFSFASSELNMVETAYVETNAAAPTPELDLVGITFGTGLTW